MRCCTERVNIIVDRAFGRWQVVVEVVVMCVSVLDKSELAESMAIREIVKF